MKGRRTIQNDAAPTACPACGAEAPVRIAYGYPTGDMFEASERGRALARRLLDWGELSALGLPGVRAPLGRPADADRWRGGLLQRREGGAD